MGNDPINLGMGGGMRQITESIFDLDSSVKSIMRMLARDVEVAVESDSIPSGAGCINVTIDQKGDEYDLRFESNGRGITQEEVKQRLSIIGQSSFTGGNDPEDDFWILAPFHFSPDSYIFITNPRPEGEAFAANSRMGGFDIIENGGFDSSFGMRIELTIKTDEHTVPEIGQKIRDTAEDAVNIPVEYELREDGVSKEQIHINY